MSVTLTITKSRIAILTLARVEKHNAFDDVLINEMIRCIEHASTLDVRALVLKSEGKHFSAGADLNWMKSMKDNSFEDNVADSMELARLMQVLYECPLPTVCLVQGAAFGGALGLIACCDIALADKSAKFCLSEVKLGLIPAVISPYVINAMGERNARRYFLTAEVFNAEQAQTLGLIHELSDDLDASAEQLLSKLADNGPQAVKAAKRLIAEVAHQPIDDSLRQLTAERIAAIRVSDEGQIGLTAFFEKQAPAWQQQG
ncbi:enoyl-CoA hydratase-related protein [Pseudoalteromonas sp. MM17-2]|uniref:enoyl-CoA hydratase-related protein n=1 Tax=Pseudoalteromonas sp. MM17-2 TaxID=2917753 RepID=UPI001EF6F608|nr:enoyl-CoA hydratase-related protein [Pseudoalteromonas sp. MM17-2]MCG7542618.1 enoyl-CoA hydratase-related protein [Pseudoalteromonas sp. MM17-2]